MPVCSQEMLDGRLVLGPVPGLAAGLMAAVGTGAMTAWGRWLVLARIWPPLSRRGGRETVDPPRAVPQALARSTGLVIPATLRRVTGHLMRCLHRLTAGVCGRNYVGVRWIHDDRER